MLRLWLCIKNCVILSTNTIRVIMSTSAVLRPNLSDSMPVKTEQPVPLTKNHNFKLCFLGFN